MLLEAHNLEKGYGIQKLFSIDKLEIGENDRIGLVGANGCGKSTLLKILSGQTEADAGTIKASCSIAYITQEQETEGDTSAYLLSRMNLKDSACKSGGEKTRLAIAAAFSRETKLLFADEPTTNLDVKGIETLEKMLKGFKGAFVLVSHDRYLLDQVCDTIWEIGDEELRVFPGNFTAWSEQKNREREYALFEYEQYQTEKKHLESAMHQIKHEAEGMRRPPKRMGSSEWILYKGTAAIQQGHVQNRGKAIEKRLDKLEKKEKPKDLPKISMKMGAEYPMEGKNALTAEHIKIAYGKATIIKDAGFKIAANKCTVMMGPNGTGKTSVLRKIIEQDPAVRLSPQARLGYFAQEHETLDPDRTVLQNVRSTSSQKESVIRAILANLYLTSRDIEKPVSVLSGGERAKVMLAKLLASDANFLILDEPTNHIDMYTAEALEALLKQWKGTLLLVTHDRRLAQEAGERFLFFEKGEIRTFEGNWKEYETSKERMEKPGDSAELQRTLLNMKMMELTARVSSPKKGERVEQIREELERVTEEYYRLGK
ncbi:ABC-F type ribosomal protection protein [Lactonifactor longoviformis]|uniref:Macrolide transport system ATP-binding/permease protein n=1 Tax=Lactonifactor longoviformis DSM 17459 TaxID=1122155 RepID=A0A1M5CSU5_9CLOT|nr:ABC-F type ribosomal protection protein [Lactonifactor longoviformis]POP32411.1 ABC-F type ribosomal protection protein [Lactonifactor longoviformis]SHF57808.1 macrolide transport system ATP-binding/permease protein [Lactonifactor longoviformis DSM 17459]